MPLIANNLIVGGKNIIEEKKEPVKVIELGQMNDVSDIDFFNVKKAGKVSQYLKDMLTKE